MGLLDKGVNKLLSSTHYDTIMTWRYETLPWDLSVQSNTNYWIINQRNSTRGVRDSFYSYTKFRLERRHRLSEVYTTVNSSEIPSLLWLLAVSLASPLQRNIRAASSNARTCWRKEKNHRRHSPYAQQWGEDEDWRGHQEEEMNSLWWTGETPETKQETGVV